MKRKIYLHIGFHKTGSTSIQHSFWRNKGALEDKGILYPELYLNEKEFKTSPNHSYFFKEWFNHGTKRLSDDEDYYGKQILGIEKNSDILFSAEVLCRPKKYASFRRFLLKNFPNHEIETIAYVRSPYDLMCSLTAMMVNGGKYFDLYNAHEQLHFMEDQIFELKKFKEVSFYSYGVIKNTTKHFANLIEVNLSDQVKLNKGYGNKSIRDKNQKNKINPHMKGGMKLYDNDSKFYLTKNELENNKKYLDRLNYFYERELGQEFCDISYPTCN